MKRFESLTISFPRPDKVTIAFQVFGVRSSATAATLAECKWKVLDHVAGILDRQEERGPYVPGRKAAILGECRQDLNP